MRILTIDIYGFGHFTDRHFGPFTSPVTVIYGANEAGKSTLLAFIRTVLFGFPKTKTGLHYPALNGGRHGGRITLESEDGGLYVVERVAGAHGGTLTITTPEGRQCGDETLLRALLGHQQMLDDAHAEARMRLMHALRLQHVDADAEDHAEPGECVRAASIRLFISRTAAASPSNSARAMIAWPMLSSSTWAIAATGATLW